MKRILKYLMDYTAMAKVKCGRPVMLDTNVCYLIIVDGGILADIFHIVALIDGFAI